MRQSKSVDSARFRALFNGVRANLTELLESPIWEQITDINALLGGFCPSGLLSWLMSKAHFGLKVRKLSDVFVSSFSGRRC